MHGTHPISLELQDHRALCKHSFCRSCMSSYIMTTIGDGVAKVRCPGLQCKARLNPLRCKELISSKSFLMWCDLLCESHDLGLARSYCPNSNCQEVIVNECEQSGHEKRFECPRCHRKGCFQCARAWTKGHRCKGTHDVDLRLLKNLGDGKKWMRCPDCHMYVERDGGCFYVFCRCQTLFCHHCGQRNDLRPCPRRESQIVHRRVSE